MNISKLILCIPSWMMFQAVEMITSAKTMAPVGLIATNQAEKITPRELFYFSLFHSAELFPDHID